ncbi:MAG: DUF3667 domain-containing protein [Gammaproteobacteria bacterium]|nr:DUF3667 domain-containing protein [Gammaproteobacteria bacterium]
MCVENDQPTKEVEVVTTCDSCKAVLTGLYCSQCGQKNTHYNRSLFLVIGDFVKELFDVDAYVFKSLFTLFFKPGRLSVEFRENKRARYIRPIRLYLFSNLMFFAIVAITAALSNSSAANDSSTEVTLIPPTDSEKTETLSIIDRHIVARPINLDFDPHAREIVENLLFNRGGTFSTGYANVKQQIRIIDSAKRVENAAVQDVERRVENLRKLLLAFRDSEEIVNTVFHHTESAEAAEIVSELLRQPSSFLKDTIINLANSLRTEEQEEILPFLVDVLRLLIKIADDPRRFIDDMIEKLPIMMFLLLPIIVLLLATIQLGKGIRLVFQLIYAMHAHAVIFILSFFGILAAILMASLIPGDTLWIEMVFWPILQLLILVHTFLSFKHFYGSGIFVSIFKFLVILNLYLMTLVVGIAGLFLWTVISL